MHRRQLAKAINTFNEELAPKIPSKELLEFPNSHKKLLGVLVHKIRGETGENEPRKAVVNSRHLENGAAVSQRSLYRECTKHSGVHITRTLRN